MAAFLLAAGVYVSALVDVANDPGNLSAWGLLERLENDRDRGVAAFAKRALAIRNKKA
jgi:hypothetical protein